MGQREILQTRCRAGKDVFFKKKPKNLMQRSSVKPENGKNTTVPFHVKSQHFSDRRRTSGAKE